VTGYVGAVEEAHPWVAEAQHLVRFGIFGGGGADWAAARDWAQTVEGLGFDSLWVPDHPIGFTFDCWTRMVFLAETTRRVPLGSLVSCVYYRDAGLLARHAADVDAVSGGRLVLGLGIGDAEPEFRQLGLAFPSVSARQRALEEHLQTVPRLLRGETVSYAGTAVRFEETKLAASAIQQPRVPVLLAGGGEKVTLRQVAHYADAANFGPNSVAGNAWTPDDVRRKYAVLDTHRAAYGRTPESVLHTFVNFGVKLVDGVGSGPTRVDWTGIFEGVKSDSLQVNPEQAVAYFRALAKAGVNYFIVSLGPDPAALRRLAEEVVPAVTAGAIATH
jgi:alkanesulfonate monooxygenase SsuD/methylene tetrahydromethanopterin reductase-like flavin-dependent oxidoreductase (luciferase family)